METMKVAIATSVFLCTLCFYIPLQAETLPQRRARPPQWSDKQIGVFFEDAREHLVGERPAAEGAENKGQGAEQSEDQDTRVRWSKVIAAETLTAEVKRISNRLNLSLRRIGPFKSGGNQEVQREFAILTTVFDVMAQHDRNSRLKDSAPLLRDLCYRAMNACDEPTKAAYDLSKQTHATLQDALNGMSQPAEELEPAELVLQTLLMQRMEQAVEETLKPSLSSEGTFRKATNDIRREAQVLAMLAQVIQHPDSDYGDDDDFLGMAKDLQRASREMADGVEAKDYNATRAAFGHTTQSCSACHEGYRG